MPADYPAKPYRSGGVERPPFRLAFQFQGSRQVGFRIGEIRLQADGFPELADRAVGAAHFVEDRAEVFVYGGVILMGTA
jgi:hypothetical protein